MMTTTSPMLGPIMVICLTIASSTANAQASRTWVSGVGDDANPCSRTAPCKTFPGAMSKTAAGGEIDALDPGGFGAITITKAITLDGGGGQVASILVAGTNAIMVQAGPNDVVTLRNLRINGIGTGLNGIRFLSGAAINIQNCYIFGFTQNGIDIVNAGQANISDTVVFNNTGGIHIRTNGAGRMLAALLRVQMNDNSVFGLSADGSGGTGVVSVSVTDSQASNSNNGIGASGTLSSAGVIINRSAIVNNTANGLVTGPNGVIVVGNSTVQGNGTGVNASAGGAILTNGNNSLIGNFISNGSFSGPAPLQ